MKKILICHIDFNTLVIIDPLPLPLPHPHELFITTGYLLSNIDLPVDWEPAK